MIKLGQKVKHNLIPFAGTAVARCEYLAGCVQIKVLAHKLKDGAPVTEWFDESDLAVVTQKTAKRKPVTGGDRPAPPSRSMPNR